MGVRPGAARDHRDHRDAQLRQPERQPSHLQMALEGSVLAEYLQPSGKPFTFATSPFLLSLPQTAEAKQGAGVGTLAFEQPQLAWSRSLDRKVLAWCTERLPPAGAEDEHRETPPVTSQETSAKAAGVQQVCAASTDAAVASPTSTPTPTPTPRPAPGRACRVPGEPRAETTPATLETCSVTCPGTCQADATGCSSRQLLNELLMDIYKVSATSRRLSNATLTPSTRDSASSGDERGAPPLRQRSLGELRQLRSALTGRVALAGARLGKHLRRRDQLRWRQERQQDIISAHLIAQAKDHAAEDGTAGLRFSVAPAPGDSGFTQWLSAMQMVARLQGGIPPEFRRTLWLTLADKHLQRRGVDWAEAERLCFSEWSNPDDDELGVQIVKDLHRTGCSMFCGQSNQAVLKRVLLAYARWNKAVGYCQGFNMLAALILQVMDRNEPDSVKVMIYLIEGVLPESYFANNLRGLSVDMAVFRDLLRLRLPRLSRHLEHLQMDAGDNTGTSYEPPLTNVFTMQWFLTLFCNCLPQPTVLRVWDLIFLEGNQILLRTALAIWDHLAERIMAVNSADEFYSIMGVLTREILEFGHVDSNRLMKTVVAMQCPELPALRDKYMYNITPWTSTVSSGLRRGLRLFYTEDDSGDSGDNSDQDDDERIAVAAAFGIADLFRSPRRRGGGPPKAVETLHWRDEDRRRKSLADGAVPQAVPQAVAVPPSHPSPRPRPRSGSADSISSGSSTSTELCDDPGHPSEPEEDHGDLLEWDTKPPMPAKEAPGDKEKDTVEVADQAQPDAILVDVAGDVDDVEVEPRGADDLMQWDTRQGDEQAGEEDVMELLARLREEEQALRLAGPGGDAQEAQEAAGDDGRASPERVVASVTEKLRHIMEHLERGLSRTPSEDAASRDSRDCSSPTSTSSRENRQRLMDRLFGGSLMEESFEEASAASLKSSALELDLSELLDDEEGPLRARSAAGDVEGVTASSRRVRLDRQNSERASRIIRENSEILQRITAWQQGGRSLTLPERSEPPDLFASPSPVLKKPPMTLFEEEEALPATSPTRAAPVSEETPCAALVNLEADTERAPDAAPSAADVAEASLVAFLEATPTPAPSISEYSSTVQDSKVSDAAASDSSLTQYPMRVSCTPSVPPAVSEAEPFPPSSTPRVSDTPAAASDSSSRPSPGSPRLSRTASQDVPQARLPRLPLDLAKQSSLDETRWSARKPDKPLERLQLILEPDGEGEASSRAAKPRYKFPEMSPLPISPLQPLPGTSLRGAAEPGHSGLSGQPKKWRPELSPPSTPEAASTTVASYPPLRGKQAVVPPTPAALDAPTTLPVQTPSLPREGPRDAPRDAAMKGLASPASPASSASPSTSPSGRSSGRRRKGDHSPESASGSLKSPGSFNPFPSRTTGRQPKEIGVKLGLYPSATSPSTAANRKTDRT